MDSWYRDSDEESDRRSHLSQLSKQSVPASGLHIVSRVAVEGKAKATAGGATVKLFLKLEVPVDEISPGKEIPLFAEDANVKIRDFRVHPLNWNAAPYDFSSKTNPLLTAAARALCLPDRTSTPYLSLFKARATSIASQSNEKVTANLEALYSGYFAVCAGSVCFILPMEFPPELSSLSPSDDHVPTLSSMSYGGRGASVAGQTSLLFMAALVLSIPFKSEPPRAPYLLSIPVPRSPSNTICLELFPPSELSASFESLSTVDGSTCEWCISTLPHISETPTIQQAQCNGRNTFPAKNSFNTSAPPGCFVQGAFNTVSEVRVRWALPIRDELPSLESGGRPRLRIGRVEGNASFSVVEQLMDGIKLDLFCKITCLDVSYPGVSTMLALDVILRLDGADVVLTWPADNDSHWSIDGDSSITGLNVGLYHGMLDRQSLLKLPDPISASTSHADIAYMQHQHAPHDGRRHLEMGHGYQSPDAAVNFEDEESMLRTPTTGNFSSSLSSMTPVSTPFSPVETGTSDLSNGQLFSPNEPVTLHVDMDELNPSELSGHEPRVSFTIRGTVIASIRDSNPEINYGSLTRESLAASDGPLYAPTFCVLQCPEDRIISKLTSGREVGDGAPSKGVLADSSRKANSHLTFGLNMQSKSAIELEQLNEVTHEVYPHTFQQTELNLETLAVSKSQRVGDLCSPVIQWVDLSISPSLLEVSSYAMTLVLSTPKLKDNRNAEYLEFGFAVPSNSDLRESIHGTLANNSCPELDIMCASLDGIPLKYQVFSRRGDAPENSDFFSLLFSNAPEWTGRETCWLKWIRVDIEGRQGTLELTCMVKDCGKLGGYSKGKKFDPLIPLPVFVFPVARYSVHVQVDGLSASLVLSPSHGRDAQQTFFCKNLNRVNSFAVPPFFRLQVRIRQGGKLRFKFVSIVFVSIIFLVVATQLAFVPTPRDTAFKSLMRKLPNAYGSAPSASGETGLLQVAEEQRRPSLIVMDVRDLLTTAVQPWTAMAFEEFDALQRYIVDGWGRICFLWKILEIILRS